MYHRLHFRGNHQVDLHIPGKARLERVLIKQDTVIEAVVRPFVHETEKGPVEVADLYLPGDGVLRAVCMKYFTCE